MTDPYATNEKTDPRDEKPLDRWLDAQLRQLHQSLLDEPIPSRLLRVVTSAHGEENSLARR